MPKTNDQRTTDMIQQQTYVDICDNTGGKEAMCIKVLRGSSSKGKFKRKVATSAT